MTSHYRLYYAANLELERSSFHVHAKATYGSSTSCCFQLCILYRAVAMKSKLLTFRLDVYIASSSGTSQLRDEG